MTRVCVWKFLSGGGLDCFSMDDLPVNQVDNISHGQFVDGLPWVRHCGRCGLKMVSEF